MSPAELEELGGQITCAQAIDFLDAYLADELPRAQRVIFEAHLAICEDCRNYLASYESTVSLVQQSGLEQEQAEEQTNSERLPPLPPELLAAILSALPLESPDN
jgi:anti-sigma factor RsiW